MSSTLSRVRRMEPRLSGRVGAMLYPQLPATTEVTPCHDEGVSHESQRTCGS